VSEPEVTGTTELERLGRQAARTLDFREGLRCVTALRRAIKDVETMHVSAALGAGASWSEIARELGISKQAAHRRHASHALEGSHGREASHTTSGDRRRILVTAEARRAVQLARQEASALGQGLVGTEHLLLGIMRCEASVAARALAGLGIDIEAARAAAQPTLAVGSPRAKNRPEAAKVSWRGLSPHARAVLERSLNETLTRSEGYIGVEHLLLALVRDKRSGAARTLKRFQIKPDDVRAQLEDTW
jgi:hypothetical protein